ncbi:hypothetical protein JCM6882_009620 [Rhodosporidiobolus microsporus]
MPPKGTAYKVRNKPPRQHVREVDLNEGVFIDDFESGRKPGGLKAWNEAHEKPMAQFYAGRPLPAILPARRLNAFLDEASFASRERGRQANAECAIAMSLRINAPDFEDKHIKPFKRMTQLERKGTILKALSDVARDWEARELPFGWQGTLVPEVALDKLCADDGDGLAFPATQSFLPHFPHSLAMRDFRR